MILKYAHALNSFSAHIQWVDHQMLGSIDQIALNMRYMGSQVSLKVY
jgi:hypothetical protein